MSALKKRNIGSAKIIAALASCFGLLLVVSPAFAANTNHSSTLALGIILPALALCSAIIFGVWHQTSRTKLKSIRVRNTHR